ncbi:MAG: hypothetical protein ACRD3J_26870, partial [Thermoanaerobaculia bacterium]
GQQTVGSYEASVAVTPCSVHCAIAALSASPRCRLQPAGAWHAPWIGFGVIAENLINIARYVPA